MYHVYVLKSLKNGKRYVGFTEKEAMIRLSEHNRGTNKWSRENKPFIMVRVEEYLTKTEAIKREKFLKSGQGRTFLDSIL